MENNTNHLDYNAPLRSVRRFHSAIAAGGSRRSNRLGARAASTGTNANPAEDKPQPTEPELESQPRIDVPTTQRPSSLPIYKSDLKSGQYREPGVVPFVWEQAAGCPKVEPAQCSSSAGLTDEEPAAARQQIAVTSNSSLPQTRDAQPSHRDDNQSGTDAPSSSQQPSFKSAAQEKPPEKPKSAENSLPTSGAKARKGSVKSAPTAAAPSNGADDNASDAFSDALDTLSLADSCFMNCSVSGTTAFPDAANQTNGTPSGKGSGGSFSTDPQVRDFMMGRFLPAAQAMAATSPPPGSSAAARRNTPERSRPVRNGERRQPEPLPYQNRPHAVLRYPAVHHNQVVDERRDEDTDDSDDDEDAHQFSKHMSLKGCGLLPRFCFSIMNQVPGARMKGRLPSPHRRMIQSAAPGRTPSPRRLTPPVRSDQVGERTWEAVYKHKLGRPDQRHPLDNGSKLTSGESNQLTYWSDSQSPEGSSPFRRSTGGSPSPFAHEANTSPFREDEGSVGTPPKPNSRSRMGKEDSIGSGSRGSDKYLDFGPHSATWSGSGSPAAEKTLYVDSVNMSETPTSRFNPVDSGRMDSKLLLEDSDVTNATQPDLQPPDSSDKSATADDNCKDAIMGNELVKVEDTRNNDLSIVQALLPPPLPKSPSESWLWRTLPKNNKKGAQTSIEPKWEAIVKGGTQLTG